MRLRLLGEMALFLGVETEFIARSLARLPEILSARITLCIAMDQ
jgi:hypothetical protein